jgi:hypothetical protein
MNLRALRTLRGQAWLFGATLVVAVGLAGVAASQRAFFERHVLEKYPAVSATAADLARRIERGDRVDADLRATTPVVRADLYGEWMQRPAADARQRTPATLMTLDPAFYRERVEMTLAGGSADQRARALLFVRASRSAVFAPSIRWTLERARATGDERLRRDVESIELDGPAVAGSAR